MKLCRCDMCETVLDLDPAPTPYGEQAQVPQGWAVVSIARTRAVRPTAPANRHTMTVEGDMGEVELTAETDETEPPPYIVHTCSQLHLCEPCLERLVTHPSMSKRIAEDDARAEVAQMPTAGPGFLPAMRVSMRRK